MLLLSLNPTFPSRWILFLALIVLGSALAAAGHAVLYKRDNRGAMLWVGLIWLLPLVGPAFYFAFGINRIKRRALLLRRPIVKRRATAGPALPPGGLGACQLPEGSEHLAPLLEIVRKATGRDLVPGNWIETLVNGDNAYPAMLDAISRAEKSIGLSTYIFDRDHVGTEFAERLAAAVRRGVEVRVLIDATGTFFSWPPILGALRRGGVRYARFLPAFSLFHPVALNLRNHRKLLIIDGRVGFTGGMNICAGHWLAKRPLRPMSDVHFRVLGPVVAHLQEAFADDWLFTTGEALRGGKWFPPLAPAGNFAARGIADGPDEGFEKIRWTMLAAITSARASIRIVTPYFLPDTALISALNVAAMRGVDVRILLPRRSDVPFVQWASAAMWWQMLEHGCRLWVDGPPFDHSKIFLVDDRWALLGSANWDPRSLRLNFEFDLECYDAGFAADLAARVAARMAKGEEITLARANARSLPVRLRDGLARLFAPFL